MDRLAKIKHAHSLRGPGNNGLVSEDERWLLTEVERLRKIEDAAIGWSKWETNDGLDAPVDHLFKTLEANPRPKE